MNKANNKARKYSSSILKELLNEVTPLEMEQTKIKMQLAARIEDCMRHKAWNKSEFAEQLGKNPSEITKWLSGTHNFTIDILTQIAHTLGVELTSLLGKPQTQVVYRNEIVVKSVEVPVYIPFFTPYDQGVDNETCLFTTQVSSQYKQYLT